MRLVEEVYVKADKDLIYQSCGCDIPEGSNHLLESYVHKGKISTSHYCLKKKCNPKQCPTKTILGQYQCWPCIMGHLPFFLQLRIFRGLIKSQRGVSQLPYTPRHTWVVSNSWKAESFHFLNLIMS